MVTTTTREKEREEEERFILDPLRQIAKTFNRRTNEINYYCDIFFYFYYHRGKKE
ncbi:MAG TPA: hypothetical protein VFK40_14335 [Nitrososphaeraceae archaeon]|nr:hypothetical protein [Nitrososphaeraceae archaeon]HET8794536.1 hypothetical protein [Nitrososphaeraceae archaeon]